MTHFVRFALVVLFFAGLVGCATTLPQPSQPPVSYHPQNGGYGDRIDSNAQRIGALERRVSDHAGLLQDHEVRLGSVESRLEEHAKMLQELGTWKEGMEKLARVHFGPKGTIPRIQKDLFGTKAIFNQHTRVITCDVFGFRPGQYSQAETNRIAAANRHVRDCLKAAKERLASGARLIGFYGTSSWTSCSPALAKKVATDARKGEACNETIARKRGELGAQYFGVSSSFVKPWITATDRRGATPGDNQGWSIVYRVD